MPCRAFSEVILVAYHYKRVGKSAWSGFKPFAFPFRHFNAKERLMLAGLCGLSSHVWGLRDLAEPTMKPNKALELTADSHSLAAAAQCRRWAA